MPILLIAALFALGGGGVAVLADNSLPGDALYSIKVQVNENARLALSFSEESKGILSGKLAAKRLEEAEELINESRLTPELAQKIKANFEKNAANVSKRGDNLGVRNKLESAIKVNSAFVSKLQAHERILVELKVYDPRLQGEMSSILELVRNNIASLNAASNDAETRMISSGGPEVEAAAKGKLKAAENKIQEVARFIEKIKSEPGAFAVSEAETRFQVAKNVLDAGKVKLNAAQYGEAFQYFQKSIRTAEEAQILANAKIGVPGGKEPENQKEQTATSSGKVNANSGKSEVQNKATPSR